ncbi:hypothetical protein MTO96_038471 [Rhipicephalus appendiculatus]
MERFRFNNRSRWEGESLGQFVAAQRGLASTCAFGDELDWLLRDRFVCGVNNPAMQTRLLEFPDPLLDDVVKAALAMDAATKDAGEIARTAASRAEKLGTLHEYAERGNRTVGRSSSLDQAQVPSPARVQGRRRKRRRGSAGAGPGSSAARFNVMPEDPPIFDMWHTGLVPLSVPPYMLTVEVCGRPISTELDTGGQCAGHGWETFQKDLHRSGRRGFRRHAA